MKRSVITITMLLVISSILPQVFAQQPAEESPAQRNARMQWWREARFGLFIHWGVYSVPAGTYKGKQIDGIGEWIMRSAEIPVTEYRAFAKQFNPVKYDPEAWAALAEEAGMKYIVITSKHHDGFALFPSDVTDWDVADASPYGKDLIGPLAAAAQTRAQVRALLFPGPRLDESRRRQGRTGRRPRLVRGTQGKVRRVSAEDRRAADTRDPDALQAGHPLVGHSLLDDARACRSAPTAAGAPAGHHLQQSTRRLRG